MSTKPKSYKKLFAQFHGNVINCTQIRIFPDDVEMIELEALNEKEKQLQLANDKLREANKALKKAKDILAVEGINCFEVEMALEEI